MLLVECERCKLQFWVKGYTTPDCWMEPSEIVTELECADELCACLQDGGTYTVLDESIAYFDDDVI